MSTRSCSSALLAAVVVFLACSRHADTPDQHAVRTTITRYNQHLVEAYRAGRPELLHGVVGSSELARATRVIDGLAERGLVMEARQKSIQLEKIDVEANGWAVADSLETWEYEHRPAAARERSIAAKTATYHLLYRLRREGTGWIVDQVVDRDLPGPQRPL